MAVINITPDSFFKRSRVESDKELLKKTELSIHQGADWIDLGAVSTRPGSSLISSQEERKRIMPALKLISQVFPDIPLSIDTYRFEIAQEALEKGASIINDVSYGQDEQLIKLCIEKNTPYVLMHMRGAPNQMMGDTKYQHVVSDVYSALQMRMETLKSQGMTRIVLDPGFGFSKTLKQNYDILKHLDYFKALNAPVMVGLSRKSMIYKVLDCDADDALNGTTALHAIALMKGADILRVHDVKEAVECKKLLAQFKTVDLRNKKIPLTNPHPRDF